MILEASAGAPPHWLLRMERAEVSELAKLDREDPRPLVWQRFLYRQLMYAVVLRSLKTAASGMRTGWGKLERKGTVEMHGQVIAEPAELQVREAQ